jgi:enterochelin esterase-like enzyme
MKSPIRNITLLFILMLLGINSVTGFGQNIFSDFYERINKTDDVDSKQQLADEFYASINKDNYPIFENDSTVVLLYKGEVDTVVLLGDMGDWTNKIYMNRIESTDLFFHRGNYEPDSRMEYWLILNDKDDRFSIDSLNQYIVRNGLGEFSELAMPQYVRHPLFNSYIHGEKGNFENLIEKSIPSKYMNYDHTVHIYLPPGYDSSNQKYPVVYFQDGKDYIEFAVAHHIIENLIKENKIAPVIAVLVTPPNLHQPKIPNRSTEYGMNDDYVSFFVKELVPTIDQKFRTINSPDNRLVVGDSYGGLISLYIGFTNPKIFGKIYSQSGYHSFNKDSLIKLINNSDLKPINIYLDVGTYEHSVGANFLPEGERDFLAGNRRMKKVLEKKRYDFKYAEYHEGHTWGNWRRHLIDALMYLFGKKND